MRLISRALLCFDLLHTPSNSTCIRHTKLKKQSSQCICKGHMKAVFFHTSPAYETLLHPVTHFISQSYKDVVYPSLKIIIGMNALFLNSWNQICTRIPKVNYWGDKQPFSSQVLSALFQENSDSVSQLWMIWFLPSCREQLPKSM